MHYPSFEDKIPKQIEWPANTSDDSSPLAGYSEWDPLCSTDCNGVSQNLNNPSETRSCYLVNQGSQHHFEGSSSSKRSEPRKPNFSREIATYQDLAFNDILDKINGKPQYAQKSYSNSYYSPQKSGANNFSSPKKMSTNDFRSPARSTTNNIYSPMKSSPNDYCTPRKSSMNNFNSPMKSGNNDFYSPMKSSNDFYSPMRSSTNDCWSPMRSSTNDYWSPMRNSTNDYRSPMRNSTNDYRSPSKSSTNDFSSPLKSSTNDFSSPLRGKGNKFYSHHNYNANKIPTLYEKTKSNSDVLPEKPTLYENTSSNSNGLQEKQPILYEKTNSISGVLQEKPKLNDKTNINSGVLQEKPKLNDKTNINSGVLQEKPKLSEKPNSYSDVLQEKENVSSNECNKKVVSSDLSYFTDNKRTCDNVSTLKSKGNDDHKDGKLKCFTLFPEKSSSSPSILDGFNSYFTRISPPRPRCLSDPQCQANDNFSQFRTDTRETVKSKLSSLPELSNSIKQETENYKTDVKDCTKLEPTAKSLEPYKSKEVDKTNNVELNDPYTVINMIQNKIVPFKSPSDYYTFQFKMQNKTGSSFLNQPAVYCSIKGGKITYNWTDVIKQFDSWNLAKKEENVCYKSESDFLKEENRRKSYKKSNQQVMECKFCKSNLESQKTYRSHTLKQRIGKRTLVTCPILRKLVCERCGETGDNAHTLSYCPLVIAESGRKPLSIAAELKKTKRVASGKVRRAF